MPSVKFFRFASRMPAYAGALQARAQEESEYDESGYKRTENQYMRTGNETYTEPVLIPITYEN